MKLQTTILGVEAELLALAADAHGFRLIAKDDLAGRYAFLFGMATVKLAEANSEIARLRAHVSELEAESDRAPHDHACACEACNYERAADAAAEAE